MKIQLKGTHRKHAADNLFHDLGALERRCCDYSVGRKCYHPNQPQEMYSVTKVLVLPSSTAIATLQPLQTQSNNKPLDPIEIFSDEFHDWIFLPCEEQRVLLKTYLDKEIVEGLWKTQLSSEFITQMNPLVDQLADSVFFDFVPGTENIVRNILDPSLYALRRDDTWWGWLVSDS
jgi:hypothetical protein